jgi:enoyl-CoA hydratase/carnithine racemase
MMTTPSLIIEKQGRVLRLIINNPMARNSLDPVMYQQGCDALLSLPADIGAVVLSGNEAMFCAGGNLQRLLGNRDLSPEVQAASINALHGFVKAIRACPKPVLAAVEGAAAGAGFSLALACDLLVSSREAKFVMSYAKVGLSPDGGATRALAMALPRASAFEILACATPISAARLAELGVVNRLSEPGQAIAQTLAWAQQLADGPKGVYARLKTGLQTMAAMSLEQALDLERNGFVASLFEPDAKEGIEAFLQKRPARFLP